MNWARNPVDRFVLSGLEQKGLAPSPPAGKRQLVRRAYLDLIGLPPSLDETEAFVNDTSADAYQKLIDRLLSKPQYGERWGRHWLDLVRYADTNGYESDDDKPLVWAYRDYVIRALNQDKPFNRFILEQLAGDELPDANTETVIATGYYRLGPWDAERGASVQKNEMIAERFNELDDIVSTTSQVFLGLTMGCARCHDHKFDPLTTNDYYNMVAVFNPLTRPRNDRTEQTRPAATPAQLKAKSKADRRINELKKQIQALQGPLRTGLLESGQSKLPADAVKALQRAPEKRSDEQKKLVDQYNKQFEAQVTAATQRKELVKNYLSAEAREALARSQNEVLTLEAKHHYPQAYFLYESSPQPPVTHLLIRGAPNQPGPVVWPAVPAVLVNEQPQFLRPDEFTSRRRLSLARWIASPRNPLTLRVVVNRVWQHHFGLGLVRTPSNFGIRGDKPTHPRLLDWLDDWFLSQANWSLKRLHRLIMTSNTYRMGKHWNPSAAVKDPDNNLLWRFPYRRLEVEAIRDSMLAVSGQLNRKMFGPSIYPYLSEEATRGQTYPQKAWKPFDEEEASRRTIYAFVKRSLVVPLFEVLDFCDTARSADRRDVTTVPTQALTLFNGNFVNRQAGHFANRLMTEAGSEPNRQIELAYRLALSRPPTAVEHAEMRAFLEAETGNQIKRLAQQQGSAESDREAKAIDVKDARRLALAQMCRVLFNLNEFVYTD